MTQLHSIDRPDGKYSDEDMEKFMVFCILDTAVSYESVCKAWNELDEAGMTTRKGLKRVDPILIKGVLASVGYRWAGQKALYLKHFANNKINLKTATRKELVNSVYGIGMKLASMFLRNTRGHQYAVLDVHTLRFLQNELGEKMPKKYEDQEKMFINIAKMRHMNPMELDLKIWQENRIGNRKK